MTNPHAKRIASRIYERVENGLKWLMCVKKKPTAVGGKSNRRLEGCRNIAQCRVGAQQERIDHLL